VANTPLLVSVRAAISMHSFRSSGGAAKDPLNNQVEFSSKKRIENQGMTLPPSGAVEITLSDENIDRIDLLRIVAMTPNRSLVLKFGGDPTGTTYNAPYPEACAFFMGTPNSSVIRIENPSDSNAVDIEFSLFQREA